MSTLTESIQAMQTPQLFSSLAARTGVPDSKIRTGINAATGAIMEALAGKAHNPRAMAEAANVIAAAPDLDDPVLVLDDGAPVRQSGSNLLRIASHDISGMRDYLSRMLGFGAGTTSSLLGAASGLVVGALRRFSRSIGEPLDGSTLSSALLAERIALHDAMPIDLTIPHERVAPPSVRPSERWTFRKARQPGHRSNSWLLLLALIPLALIALWLATRPRARTDEPTSTAPLVREPATTEPGATRLAPTIDAPTSAEEPSMGPAIETQRVPAIEAPESSTTPPQPPSGTQPAQPGAAPSTMTPQPPSGTHPAQPGEAPSTMTPQSPSGTQPAQPGEAPSTMTPKSPSGTQPAQADEPSTMTPTGTQPAQPADEPSTMTPTEPSGTQPAPADEPSTTTPTQPSGTQPAPAGEPSTMTPTEPSGTQPAPAELDFPANSAESALLDQVKSSSSDQAGGQRDDKGEWIVLDAVTFASGATTMPDESADQLSHVAQILDENPAIKLEVGGYTDASGSARKNRQLSQERAKAVRDALIDKGVDASRIEAKGYGEASPIDKMNPQSEANRRVAVRVIAR